MDSVDAKDQRAYARARSLQHERPKAMRSALSDVRIGRLSKGYGAGDDRVHNMNRMGKHGDTLPSPSASLILSPVTPVQVVDNPFTVVERETAREVPLDELPVKVKRHRRGLSAEYEVLTLPLRNVIVLDDDVAEEDDDWEELSSEEVDVVKPMPTKRSYAAVVKA